MIIGCSLTIYNFPKRIFIKFESKYSTKTIIIWSRNNLCRRSLCNHAETDTVKQLRKTRRIFLSLQSVEY